MFVSRKKIESLEKRIADLEREVQDQQNEMIFEKTMEYYRKMTEGNVNPHPLGEERQFDEINAKVQSGLENLLQLKASTSQSQSDRC